MCVEPPGGLLGTVLGPLCSALEQSTGGATVAVQPPGPREHPGRALQGPPVEHVQIGFFSSTSFLFTIVAPH